MATKKTKATAPTKAAKTPKTKARATSRTVATATKKTTPPKGKAAPKVAPKTTRKIQKAAPTKVAKTPKTIEELRKVARKEEERKHKAASRARDRRIAKARKNLSGKAKEKEIATARRIANREKERATTQRQKAVVAFREKQKRVVERRKESAARAAEHKPKKLRSEVHEGRAPKEKTTFGVFESVKKTTQADWKDTEHGKIPTRKGGVIETPIAALLRAFVPSSVTDQVHHLDEIRARMDKGEPLDPPVVLCDKKGQLQVISGSNVLAIAREKGLTHVPVRWANSPVLIKPDPSYCPLESLGKLPSMIREPQDKADIEIPKGWFKAPDKILSEITRSLRELEEFINKDWPEIHTTPPWIVCNDDGTIDAMLRVRIPFDPSGPFDYWDQDGMFDFFGLCSENFYSIAHGFFKIDLAFSEAFLDADPDFLEQLAEKYKAAGYPIRKGGSEGGWLAELLTYWIESPRAGEMFFTAQQLAGKLWDKDRYVVQVDFRYYWAENNEKPPRNR